MTDSYDVVVVGGGVNGVGVVQAAAAAGYSCLLLEKNAQLAEETSSRSSKLIHGGLRYLENLEFSLVRESLQERALLLNIAPELVHLEKFNIPVYSDTNRSTLALHAGLGLYALLSGFAEQSFYHQLKPADYSGLDGLKQEGLKAVFQYYDAQTDDAALTRAVMASALTLGAECIFDASFKGAAINDDYVTIDYETGSTIKTVHARALVNASGPWVEEINRLIEPVTPMTPPDLVQGTHLVVPRHIHQAYYLEAPQDKRAIFLLPWKKHALLGTTEQIYHGDPAKVTALNQEKQYLLDVYHHYFPSHDMTILDVMTGCRVLPATDDSVFKRSRETVFHTDNQHSPKMVAIIGGKLTVYRKTADKVMQLLSSGLPSRKRMADTASLHLKPVDKLSRSSSDNPV